MKENFLKFLDELLTYEIVDFDRREMLFEAVADFGLLTDDEIKAFRHARDDSDEEAVFTWD